MLELNSKPGSQSCDLRFDIDHQAELRLNSTLQSKLVSSRSTGSNEGEVIKVQIQVFCYESMLLDSMEYSTNRRFCPAFMEFHRFGYLLCEGECPRITYASEIIFLHSMEKKSTKVDFSPISCKKAPFYTRNGHI